MLRHVAQLHYHHFFLVLIILAGGLEICWSLIVSKVPQDVIAKELFGMFWEVGFVFDVFMPQNKASALSRGFGFAHFRIEWDAKKGINHMAVLLGGNDFLCKWLNMMIGIRVLGKCKNS